MERFLWGLTDELTKLGFKRKAVAIETALDKVLRSRAGLGAAAGATLGGITSDEGLIGGLTRGALVGGAAGWGLPKLMRHRLDRVIKDPKRRKRIIEQLRRQGHRIK